MTEILPATPEGLAAAAELMAEGHLVAFPTDTVYGVACAFGRDEQRSDLVKLKGRPEDKPIPVLIAEVSQVTAAGYVLDERARRLAGRWWPGPLTLVLPASDGGEALGFRVPTIIAGPYALCASVSSAYATHRSFVRSFATLRAGRVDAFMAACLDQARLPTLAPPQRRRLLTAPATARHAEPASFSP